MTNLASLREQKELRYAKKGLALALMSGMIWSSDGLILGKGRRKNRSAPGAVAVRAAPRRRAP